MSVHYVAIGWNRQKRIYDSVLAGGILLYLAAFTAAGGLLYPTATIETLLIRGFGTLALLLLHVILCIGPLCRLDQRFLPLLYNRRHLGVAMFGMALVHGSFSMVQFHSGGDRSPLVSLLISNTRFDSLSEFPFQLPGFLALCILFVMAATSHDFWLHLLSAPAWKRLHMLVYLAYGLAVAHVLLGALQSASNLALAALLFLGVTTVSTLHILAARMEGRVDRSSPAPVDDGFVEVCSVEDIEEKRGRVVSVGGERIAVFRYDGKISALSNVCRHQNGPLGEGKIIDGCVTCPWHGYQYRPDSGMSPPPFHDQVPNYRTRVCGGKVLVNPSAMPAGTHLEPSPIDAVAAGDLQ